eukprot:scaffold6887_cov126-Isochrysis_galbana.AAC.4
MRSRDATSAGGRAVPRLSTQRRVRMLARWVLSHGRVRQPTPRQLAYTCSSVSAPNANQTRPTESPIKGANVYDPTSSPSTVTAVSCAPSFAETSAMLPRSAKCAVMEARVAPATMPQIVVHVAPSAATRTK